MQQVYWGSSQNNTYENQADLAESAGDWSRPCRGHGELWGDRQTVLQRHPAALALGKQASYIQPHIPFRPESLQVSEFSLQSLSLFFKAPLSLSLLDCFLWWEHLTSAVLANFNYTTQYYQLHSPGWDSLFYSPFLYSQLSFFLDSTYKWQHAVFVSGLLHRASCPLVHLRLWDRDK